MRITSKHLHAPAISKAAALAAASLRLAAPLLAQGCLDGGLQAEARQDPPAIMDAGRKDALGPDAPGGHADAGPADAAADSPLSPDSPVADAAQDQDAPDAASAPQAPRLLIFTRDMFLPSLAPLIDARTSEGFDVSVETYENSPKSGADAPESIRERLRAVHEPGTDNYLLLIGDVDFDYDAPDYTVDQPWELPVRYVSPYGPPYSFYDSLPTDQYYASLDGSWDDDGDGVYGELGHGAGKDEFSFEADFFVGRIPARTSEELEGVLGVALAWQPKDEPVFSFFKSSACVLSDDQKGFLAGKVRWQQAVPESSFRVHVCDGEPGGDMAAYINTDSSDIVSSFSHGWISSIGDPTQTGYYLDLQLSEQITKPPILMVYACATNAFDFVYDDPSAGPIRALGKELLRSGQATAYIGATRSHADVPFDPLPFATLHRAHRIGKMLYGYKEWRDSLEALSDRQKAQFLMFNLVGDPTLLLSKPPSIRLSSDAAIEVPHYGPQPGDTVALHVENTSSSDATITLLSLMPDDPQTLLSLDLAPSDSADPLVQPRVYQAMDNLPWSSEIRFGAQGIAGEAIALSSSIAYYGHALSTPEAIEDVGAGDALTLQVKVLFGSDEIVHLHVSYFPGCEGDGCDPYPLPQSLASLEADLSAGRTLAIPLVIPQEFVVFDQV